ncbi:MAG TPA: zf-HC2 domain-containing protein [Gemmatimonadaceae bacterium]|nr:zf-HC2 domain-containing protein [Gemmatimonadaceae bacterium]
MVDCPRDDIRDLLPDLVHDQLEPAERARVEQHLGECERCASELELLGSLRATAFATPNVDVDRIAAAVRASMAGSGAEATSEAGVVPIGEARRRLAGGSTPAAGRSAARRASRATSQRSAGVRVPQRWRIAAAVALVAAGAGGYALTSGGGASLRRPMEQATVASSERAASGAGAPAAAPLRNESKAASPAPAAPAAPAGPLVTADIAAAASSTDSAAATPGPLILGAALNELSESDMQALLQSVDDLEAMPDLEPHPLPLLASVVEGAL